MKTLRTLFSLLCLFAVVYEAKAQTEWGLISGAGVKTSLSDKVSFGIDAELRLRNDFKTMERWGGGFNVGYKLTSWLQANTGYRFLYFYDGGGSWRPGHRTFASLTGTYRFSGNIKASLRERWQYTYTSGKGKNQLRSSLTLTYDRPKALLAPYICFEMYNSWEVEKTRYIAGTNIHLSPHHTLNLFYRYQDKRENSPTSVDTQSIGVVYTLKL